MKHELQSVISGKSEIEHGTAIQAAARYLKGSERAGQVDKESKLFKKQEQKS